MSINKINWQSIFHNINVFSIYKKDCKQEKSDFYQILVISIIYDFNAVLSRGKTRTVCFVQLNVWMNVIDYVGAKEYF